MYEDASLAEQIDHLIVNLENIEAFKPENLGDSLFPTDLVSSIFNHVGNIKHLLTDHQSLMNGTEVLMAIKAADKQNDELSDQLFKARQTGLISKESERVVQNLIRDLKEAIKHKLDDEYNQ